MPTKKQRRREQKSRRHEWEYVYVDGEGQEVEVDPAEVAERKPEKTARNGSTKTKAVAKPQKQSRGAGRTIQPPSWRRVGKRALMIGPVVVIAMFLLNRDLPVTARLVPAIVMLGFFLPFSYFTDSLAYKMYKKRLDKSAAATKR